MTNPQEPTPQTYPIAREGAAETMRRRWEALAGRIAPADPAFVGHRLGHEARYPRDLTSAERVAAYEDVGPLADAGFALGLDVLELDVRVLPDPGETTVHVAHDALPSRAELPAACRDYLERNTLAGLLDHFVARGHHERSRLAIEIKLELDEARERWHFGELEERLIAETAATIGRAADGARGLRAAIGFISFSLEALERMRALAGPEHDYFLIATTDLPDRSIAVRVLWGLLPFDPALADRVAAAGWLSGVWLDPTFFVAPEASFTELNRRRGEPLRLYASTYFSPPETFAACFPGQTPLPIEGLVFELE